MRKIEFFVMIKGIKALGDVYDSDVDDVASHMPLASRRGVAWDERGMPWRRLARMRQRDVRRRSASRLVAWLTRLDAVLGKNSIEDRD